MKFHNNFIMNLVANTIFGKEEELLMGSFMEKIEKNIIPNCRKGKNLIKASTVLEITLEDYIHSRKNNLEVSNLQKENQTEVNSYSNLSYYNFTNFCLEY